MDGGCRARQASIGISSVHRDIWSQAALSTPPGMTRKVPNRTPPRETQPTFGETWRSSVRSEKALLVKPKHIYDSVGLTTIGGIRKVKRVKKRKHDSSKRVVRTARPYGNAPFASSLVDPYGALSQDLVFSQKYLAQRSPFSVCKKVSGNMTPDDAISEILGLSDGICNDNPRQILSDVPGHEGRAQGQRGVSSHTSPIGEKECKEWIVDSPRIFNDGRGIVRMTKNPDTLGHESLALNRERARSLHNLGGKATFRAPKNRPERWCCR